MPPNFPAPGIQTNPYKGKAHGQSVGVVSKKVLKECNLTEKWLFGVLKKEKLLEKEVFLMTCDPSAKYYIVKKESTK